MNITLSQVGENISSGLTSALGEVWYLVLINFIGVLAILFKITETQNKDRQKIIFLAILNYLCWITYFILNGNLTSASVNAISMIQALVFLQRGKHKWAEGKFWLYFFIGVQVLCSFFTYKEPFSLFSICAGLVSTVAYFVMDEKIYRYCFLTLILLWIGNGIVYFYPIALIHDVFGLVSIVIAIVRYNILGKNKTSQKETEQIDEEKEQA